MITETYQIGFVVLSFIVAVISYYTAAELADRVASLSGKIAMLWLAAGSCSVGFGFWTMYFVGLLALDALVPYSFNWVTTLATLLVAIIVSILAIWVDSKKSMGLAKIGLSGLLLCAGGVAMHYVGIAVARYVQSGNTDLFHRAENNPILAVGLASAALGILGTTLLTVHFGRYAVPE